MNRFYSAVFLIPMFFTLQLSAQTGKYDLNFSVFDVDCENMKLYIDIQIKAHESDRTFHLSDQNYRLKFNRTLVHNSAFIEQELDVSNYIESPTGYSLYKVHTLTGSLDSIVSYNIEFISGEGLLIGSDEWTNVGRLGFDIADINQIARIIYMDESMFPPTFIGEFYDETRMIATAGDFEILEINLSEYCDIEPPFSDQNNNSEGGTSSHTTTDIINIELENSVTLFPTLATDIINLDCADNICGDWRIIDIQGKVIQHWKKGQSTASVKSFDISTLPSGSYFIQTNIDGYYLTRRFVKV